MTDKRLWLTGFHDQARKDESSLLKNKGHCGTEASPVSCRPEHGRPAVTLQNRIKFLLISTLADTSWN